MNGDPEGLSSHGVKLRHSESTPEEELEQQLPRTKSLHRCKTAPAKDMAAVLRELQSKHSVAATAAAQQHKNTDKQHKDEEQKELNNTSKRSGLVMVRQAGLLLMLYLIMGVLVYSLNSDHFSRGVETHPLVDALYFCIVTMCTIGYGDIIPLSPSAKLFACLFVLVGFGFIDILLTGVLNYILDFQEQNILSDILHHQTNRRFLPLTTSPPNPQPNRILHLLTLRLVDVQKGRMRIRSKVGLALSVLVLSIGVGTLFLFFVERMSWVDSLYLSALSVTTVGYGDKAFNTLFGRLFASVWLLISTLAVARAFLYLVEARIHKRQRTVAKWVLQRDITPLDLLAANINNNDFINKSEYVLFKLKEMGKISEQDISQICHQFEKCDSNHMGRITLPDLLQSRSISMKAQGQFIFYRSGDDMIQSEWSFLDSCLISGTEEVRQWRKITEFKRQQRLPALVLLNSIRKKARVRRMPLLPIPVFHSIGSSYLQIQPTRH